MSIVENTKTVFSKGTPHGIWLPIIIDLGAIAGLTSVALVSLLGQSRVFYSMAHDGLLPSIFARIHPRTKTPWISTIIIGTDPTNSFFIRKTHKQSFRFLLRYCLFTFCRCFSIRYSRWNDINRHVSRFLSRSSRRYYRKLIIRTMFVPFIVYSRCVLRTKMFHVAFVCH